MADKESSQKGESITLSKGKVSNPFDAPDQSSQSPGRKPVHMPGKAPDMSPPPEGEVLNPSKKE